MEERNRVMMFALHSFQRHIVFDLVDRRRILILGFDVRSANAKLTWSLQPQEVRLVFDVDQGRSSLGWILLLLRVFSYTVQGIHRPGEVTAQLAQIILRVSICLPIHGDMVVGGDAGLRDRAH